MSAVYYAEYRPGDMISLKLGETDRYCVVQFEDMMQPALVYVRQQRIVFSVPAADPTKPEPKLTIDFGRPVSIDELRLTQRADFPHDSW